MRGREEDGGGDADQLLQGAGRFFIPSGDSLPTVPSIYSRRGARRCSVVRGQRRGVAMVGWVGPEQEAEKEMG